MQQAVDELMIEVPPKLQQRFFTIQETANLLKVSQDTVRRMLRRRQLRCVVITERTRRIPLEAINEFAQRGM